MSDAQPDSPPALLATKDNDVESATLSVDADATVPRFDAVWLLPAFKRSFERLCRREPKTRAKVWKTLNRYLSDAAALQRSPLAGARRRVFHTRVDGEKRLIDEPLGPTYPREVAALYVGHHDANEWGGAYDDDTLAKLGRAERHTHVSVGDAARPPAGAVAEPAASKYNSRRKGRAVWIDGREKRRQPTYGDVLAAREVEARGVPLELVPVVLATADSADLTSLGIDQDVADKVENWYLSKLPPCAVSVHVPSATGPEPVRATKADLAGILRLPLHKLLGTLTDDQRRLAERDTERLFVVRGAAGSGKTVVGIRRIERWVRQRELFDTRPVLFTCYNKVLAHAARQMLEDTLGQDLRTANVEVTTAFKLMSSLQLELEGKRFARLVSRSRLLGYIRGARSQISLGPTLERWTDDELLDEILEVIFARVLTSEEQYLGADRSGRGRSQRLDRGARTAIWHLFREFRRRCRQDDVAPWDQLPARLVGLLERSPVAMPRYAALVVDEVQDLPPSVLRVLLALQAGEDRNILILGDAAQNVYRNSFRWAHTGLKIAGGQVATLRRCFRSTPSIIGAAAPLIRRQRARFEDDLTVPEATGDRGPTVRVRLYATAEQELQAIAEEIGVQIESGVPPSSIGVLLDDTAARRRLQELLAVLDCHSEDFIKTNGAKFVDIFDPSVKLLTTGSAKGIEFQVLFVAAVTERQYPAVDADGETADRARRVLYTAMTRCAYELQLSSAAGEVSELLEELDGSFVDRREVSAGPVSSRRS